jgi:hypothetical protein
VQVPCGYGLWYEEHDCDGFQWVAAREHDEFWLYVDGPEWSWENECHESVQSSDFWSASRISRESFRVSLSNGSPAHRMYAYVALRLVFGNLNLNRKGR